MNIRLLFGVGLATLLSACTSSSQATIPYGTSSGRSAADTAIYSGNGATGLPGGNGATGLPGGNGATGLPGGNGATGLPGALLACTPLSTAGQAACTIAVNINIPPISDVTTPSNLLPGLHPADLQNAYSLPSQNRGGLVAIVDAYDDPNAEADLAVYRAAYGLPPCTTLNGCFKKVNQQGSSGNYPAFDAGWSEEISIDLDMVSATCPACSIELIEANSASLDDLGASVDFAAGSGAVAISNSYYAYEWSGETAEDVHYNHPGVAITVASGDQPSPLYPAASQYVTSVGGTSLSGSSGSWTQSAWSYDGQGCSAYVSRPQWQHQTSCKTRATVDVAAVADPQTGVSMYDSLAGGWLVAGGTSVGAPLIAAAYALSGNPTGPAYSYQNATAFQQIGGSGYQLPTGLGSPVGVRGF
ncbi:MAG TPA: hypothetical protein VGR69_05905 [Candidatus Rubrimentiphilum sp.]|nr:hypothetical protein [Candidatus Rubrimentiphilum sp.]